MIGPQKEAVRWVHCCDAIDATAAVSECKRLPKSLCDLVTKESCHHKIRHDDESVALDNIRRDEVVARDKIRRGGDTEVALDELKRDDDVVGPDKIRLDDDTATPDTTTLHQIRSGNDDKVAQDKIKCVLVQNRTIL